MLKTLLPALLLLSACYQKEPSISEHGRSPQSADTTDNDGDGYSEATGDCNDVDPATYPDAVEICDQVDNDCNGVVDDNIEGRIGVGVYVDLDRDGYGNSTEPMTVCDYVLNDAASAQVSVDSGDCDDQNAFIHPNAKEVCDAADNNCDGAIDEDPIDGVRIYTDNDGDGYGDGDPVGRICAELTPPESHSFDSTDCDDADPLTHPGADEYCSGSDNDCDGLVDNDAIDGSEWFLDADGDGFGLPGSSAGFHCSIADLGGEGWATNDTDCDDADMAIHPDAVERCDGVDNDCNGGLDEGLTSTFYADLDADGHGDPDRSSEHCTDPGTGYSSLYDDCNDDDASIYAGAEEIVGDEIDQDCDGTEICFVDEDDDGRRPDSTSIIASEDAFCASAGLALSTDPIGDCDDLDPASTHVSIDSDCDGALTEDDCDDTDPLIYPGATETVDDGIDDNCDGGDSVTCDDSYIVATAEDLAALRYCIEITGDLEISDTAITNTDDLLLLSTLGGDLIIEDNDTLVSVTLDELVNVSGSVRIFSNEVLDSISMEKITQTGDSFGLQMNDNLTAINGLNSLTSVGHDFYVMGNNLVEHVHANNIVSVGGMVNIWGDAITSIEMTSLDEVLEYINISSNANLVSIDFERLTYVGSQFNVNSAHLLESLNIPNLVETNGFKVNGTGLTTIEADALEIIGPDPFGPTVSLLLLSNNDHLTSFSFSALTLTDAIIQIYGNPLLCQSDVDAFIDNLTEEGCSCITSSIGEPNGDC